MLIPGNQLPVKNGAFPDDSLTGMHLAKILRLVGQHSLPLRPDISLFATHDKNQPLHAWATYRWRGDDTDQVLRTGIIFSANHWWAPLVRPNQASRAWALADPDDAIRLAALLP